MDVQKGMWTYRPIIDVNSSLSAVNRQPREP
jgi:hypothetical protein